MLIIYFLVSFLISSLYIYLSMDKPTMIVKYPTIENQGKVKYIDKAGMCYKYRLVEVKKPSDENLIFKVPVQE